MKRLAAWGFAYGAALLLLAAAGVVSTAFQPPYRGYDDSAVIDIKPGTSSRAIAKTLEEAGVIQSQWLFLTVRALRPRTVLMAGEYGFRKPMTVWQVFDKIARGDVEYYQLTFPEGLTRFEVADLVAAAGITTREEFLAETERVEYIRDLASGAASLEGFLYPDTYSYTRGITGPQFVKMMVDEFRRVFQEVINHHPSELETLEIVTLASLIEKETGIHGERALVSSVFHNRLRKNILLQCDPTVIYGLILENRYRGRIYESDLADGHLYNTYVHPGLPPGPIANPGRASLEAAVNPAETDFLYFVASPEGNGEHVFSKTLRAHNRAVAEYRRSR